MRTFIAIPLSEQIKHALFDLQEALKTPLADVKWIEPNNIHLTLKFMGELNEKKLPVIKDTVIECAREHASFVAAIASLGAFPRLESPRVIWIGLSQGDTEIKLLAEELEMRIARNAGIPKEKRPFSTHITIGRVRSPAHRGELIEHLEKFSGKNLEGKFNVDRITLYKSTLTPRGPLYEVLQEGMLKKAIT